MALFRDRSTEELKAQRDQRLSLDRTLEGSRKDDNRRAVSEITAELDFRDERDR